MTCTTTKNKFCLMETAQMTHREAVRRCLGRLGAKSLRPGAFPSSSHSTPVRVSSPGRSGRSPKASRTRSPPFKTTACSCAWTAQNSSL